MARGFDDIKNGLLFGAIFGVVAAIAISQAESLSFLTFAIDWIDQFGIWLTARDWWTFTTDTCTATTCANWFRYTFAGIIGAIIGAYVDRN